MYLGYVVGDNTIPLLKQIDESEVQKLEGDKPTLIIGYDRAVRLFPSAKPNTRILDKAKQIYYSFSREESETSYADQTTKFLRRTFSGIVKDINVVSIIDPLSIELEKLKGQKVFLYETEKLITVSTVSQVYYFNKEVSNFFTDTALTANFLTDLLGSCELWSWDQFQFFGARLKSNLCYKSKEQLCRLLGICGDVELFMGSLCLSWMEELKPNEHEEVWQRAYETEVYLSQLPIRIDRKVVLLSSYQSDNTLFESLLKQEEDGHVYQQYNGTDKVTGRMYAKGSGYSLQTLTKNIRNIIIAEPDCYLVEFDYKYFEYGLLQQLCDIPTNGDPHKQLAIELFGSAKFRDIAKGINYGTLYGKSFQLTVQDLLVLPDLTISEEELTKKLKELSKPVERLKKQLIKELKDNGYVVNPFDRQIVPEKDHAVLNNYIQSTAADMVIVKLLKIREYLKKYDPINHIVLQNHDSILLNLKMLDVEETDIAYDLKMILEEFECDLDGKVSVKYGQNWRDIE